MTFKGLPPRRATSAPNLSTAPSISPRLLRALSEPDLKLAASAYARGLPETTAPAGATPAAGAEVTDMLGADTAATHGELRWQAFLASPGTPTQSSAGIAPNVHVSLDQATFGGAQDSLTVNRAQSAGSFAVDSQNSIGLSQNPFLSSLSVTHNLGGPAAATLGASVYAGGKVKGLGVSSHMTPGGLGQTIGVAAGITAVTDNSIEVLGAQRTRADGTIERLARLKSEFMPILDISASTAAAQISVGARLSLFGGHSGVMEKFINTDKLAAMLRQRAVWYRPALETAAALGLKVGLKLSPPAKLADQVVRGNALEVGESYAFTRQKGMTFGISLGGMGAKGTVNVMTRSGWSLTLRRIDDKTYELSMAPSQSKGISGGVDAIIVGEAYASLSKSFVQRRVWHFDAGAPEAMSALAQALDGHLPGTLEASAAVDSEKMAALHTMQRDESLPPGVTNVLAELGHQTEVSAGVATLRPLLSTGLAAGLGVSRTGFDSTHGVAVARDSGVVMSRTQGSRRAAERLLGGARVESVSTTVSELNDGPAAAAFAQLEVAVDFELRSGMGTSRKAIVSLAGKLAQTALGPNADARRSDLYQMQGRWTLRAKDLDELTMVSQQVIMKAAQSSGLSAKLLQKFTADVARAQATATATGTGTGTGTAHSPNGQAGGGSDPRLSMARVVATFVKDGRSPAVVALKHLLGEDATHQMEFSVSNARHERTLAKFLAADALQQGAKTTHDTRQVVKTMESLTKRIDRQIDEINGDALLSGLIPQDQAQAVDLLGALRDSAAASLGALLDGLAKKR